MPGINISILWVTYSKSFDNNFDTTGDTNGAGQTAATETYNSPTDPIEPSSVTDGNGKVTNFTYDTFGNVLTETNPRGTTTTNSYVYTNFALGELTKTQEGTNLSNPKSPTIYSYYEPSGNIASEIRPLPGTVGSLLTVATTLTWDALGNVTSIVIPGNNAVVSKTITLSYTVDGSYTQTEALGQAIATTDGLGHIIHERYTSQGISSSSIDALGNETDKTYNIVNQTLTVINPATGETGSGRSYTAYGFNYPGGNQLTQTSYDESGNQVRLINQTYGEEGEPLITSGSTETAISTYDQLYRNETLTDGNGHTTNYFYNAQGYLDSQTYPGYSGPAPVYNSGTWSNVSGTDSLRYPSYDLDGNILSRVDGRGVVTTYLYNDPESLLTNVSYTVPNGSPVPAQPSVTLTYDSYSRLASINNGVTQNLYGYTSGSTTLPGYDDDDNTLNVQTGF